MSILNTKTFNIESWIINEFTHYQKISELLSIEKIASVSEFNPETESAEIRIEKPYQWISKVYAIGQFDYKKSQSDANKIAAAIDYDNLGVAVREMSSSLNEFMSELESALAV